MAYGLERKEDGNVYISDTGTRIILVPIEMLSTMANEFRKFVGPASKVLMREVGKSLGLAMGEVIRKELEEQENVEEAIREFLGKAGFGEVKVSSSEGCYHVTFKDAPSMKTCKTCDFEAGVISGLLEALTNKKWRVSVTTKGEECLVHAVPLQ